VDKVSSQGVFAYLLHLGSSLGPWTDDQLVISIPGSTSSRVVNIAVVCPWKFIGEDNRLRAAGTVYHVRRVHVSALVVRTR
jgi:hypothetical protein